MTTDPKPDERFAATAISLGLITESQLQEGLKVQKNMDAMGIKESLQSVLQKKGLLNQSQVAQVLRTMGVQVQPIPGYQIQSRLGQGGMGVVYKARQVSMDRTVALKVLSSQATEGKNFVDRFFREAQAAARLNHKNIIRAYDAGCANGIYYFVMEYVEGATIKHAIDREGKIEERRALGIILQAAEALQYLHENSMIHRDIKPENIMLDKEGVAKLCDFGLAKQVTGDQGVTKAGFTFGTPYYMSPEQINGRKDLDIRADVYSLGASFFHMLTGHPVFEGKDLREVLTQHLTEPAPSPSSQVPTVSERTSKIVLKMLEKDRRHRYQTPAQLIEDLNQILGGREPIHARRLQRQKGSPVLGIAALILAVLGVGGGLYYALVLNKPHATPSTPVVQKTDRPAETPKPPAPVAEEPPKRDPKDAQAESLYAKAKELEGAGSFADALAIYADLDKNFLATETFQKNRADIWKRMTECQNRMDAVASSQKSEDTKREQELRDLLKQANVLFLAGKWEEARSACETLLEKNLPEGFDRPAIVSMRNRCDNELKAPVEWAALERLAKGAQWSEFLSALTGFNSTYGSTKAILQYQRAISEYEVRAGKELAAEKAIAEARGLASQEKWDELKPKLESLKRDHGETMAYQKADAELRGYLAHKEAPVETPEAKLKEEEAKKALAKANDLFAAKKYPEAQAAYDKFLADFAGTKTAEENQSAIDKNREAMGKAVASDRDKAAAELFKQARALYNKKNYKEAVPMLENLASEYKDVKAIASNKELPKMINACKKQLLLAELELFDDFESGKLDGWFENDPAGRKITDTAAVGDKAMEISFGKHERNPSEGNWPRVLRKVEKELPPETSMIKFYGRVERKDINAKVWIEIRTGEGKNVAVYAVERQLTPKFMEYRIYLNEFRLIWGGEELQKTKAKPPLDVTKIRAIGFSEVNPHGEIGFIIDDMRFEFFADK